MSENPQQFRIAEIEVAKSLTDDKIAGVFRFEATGRTKLGPTLLVIADIQSSLYVYERLLDVLNSTAEQARYLSSQMDQDPLGRFEKLVQRLNEAVAGFTEQEASPLNWNRINIFVIELSDGHMCFTGTGHLMNLFLQKQEDDSFRSFDLFGSLEQPTPIDGLKPFGSIICGDIKPGDLLIAGSTNLERLRSELRIKERLSTLPAVTAALEIRQDLERRGIPDDFVAAIIACIEIKASAEIPAVPVSTEPEKDRSTQSIERLREQEEETAKQLSPANPVEEIRKTSTAMNSAGDMVKRVAATAAGLFSRAKQTIQKRDHMALASLRGMNAGYGTVFTKKKKTVAIVVGALLILILGGSLWWKHSRKVSAEIAAWNVTFDGATDQRNRAESDLVYGNEARARAEIDKAREMIATLPTDTPDRQLKMSKLSKDIGDLQERLKKIVKVENTLELAALGAAANPGSLAAPVLVKDTAYVVDQASGNILKISVATKETKRIEIPSGTGQIVSGTEGKDSILFATSDGNLLALSKSTDLVKPMGWSHAKTSSTTDIVLYNAKIYSLDPSNSQIWRSQQSGNSFGGETSYIKASDAPVNDGVALAIDSNVYVLKANGSVVQFLSGGQVSFGLYPIDPPIRAASNIWTGVDSTMLYITDPADKRVLLFDKSGTLKSQLTSTQFSQLRDLSVDETSKRMIVVDGNRLLLVPLP